MRTTFIAFALAAIATAAKAGPDPQSTEYRVIANAATVINAIGVSSNKKLEVYDAERAAFVGSDPPALIAQVEPCVFEMRTRSKVSGSVAAFRIDFRRLSEEGVFDCSSFGCNLVIRGMDRAICRNVDGGANISACPPNMRFGFVSNRRDADTILASVAYIHEAGCPMSSDMTPRPRY